MKKCYLLACVAACCWGAAPARAQSPGADSLTQKLSAIFAHVDKSQVPTGYLEEAGVRLVPLRHFTGALSDTNQ
jgi:hypothetical protein